MVPATSKKEGECATSWGVMPWMCVAPTGPMGRTFVTNGSVSNIPFLSHGRIATSKISFLLGLRPVVSKSMMASGFGLQHTNWQSFLVNMFLFYGILVRVSICEGCGIVLV